MSPRPEIRPPEIVVVGSINTDYILNVAALPKANETLMATSSRTVMGGKGLNQAVAAARAGARVSMVACVGDDASGARARAYLRSHGVNDDYVCTIAGADTGMANIMVAPDGQNMIVVSAGANAHLSRGDVMAAREVITRADRVVAQLEVPLEAVEAAFTLARDHNVGTVLNPAPAHMGALGVMALADVVTPNETELATLTGISETDDASWLHAFRQLEAAGAGQVVTTLGKRGSLVLIDGTLVHCAPYSVKAVDATGAGDVYNGVLSVGLAQGLSLYAAMQLATAAAAISVSRPSANSAPTREEIRAFSGL